MKPIIALLAAASLAGCGTIREQLAQQETAAAEFQRTIPICESDADCERQWAAARRWVLDHADFKLDIYSDDYMETYNSGYGASSYRWARVTKEPMNDGRYAIVIELGSNNWFSENPIFQKLSFNEYVASFGKAEASFSGPPQ